MFVLLRVILAWGRGSDRNAKARESHPIVKVSTSHGTSLKSRLHPANDPAVTPHPFRQSNRRESGPCGNLHSADKDTTATNLKAALFWSHSGFRWVARRICGLVLGVWTSKMKPVDPIYRWTDTMVREALVHQKDADPNWTYTTRETVKTCCEQLRQIHLGLPMQRYQSTIIHNFS